MQFRPCIDIHNGKVKQIVGASLKDEGDRAQENFVSDKDSAFYARFYRDKGIRGGHIILLNHPESGYFQETKAQALQALGEYPGGLQVGGGITAENAGEYLSAGASHVIVTSYVFEHGTVNMGHLEQMKAAVGRKHLVLDLSCRKRGRDYYIVTDRWQNYTSVKLSTETLARLAEYCDEFLVHAVDVEGKAGGIEEEVAALLGRWDGIDVTYAGGVHSYEDLRMLKRLGRGRIHVTIGSALSLFGGSMELDQVLDIISEPL